MSSKLKQIKRKVVITNAVWSTGTWTLTTDAAHYLAVGDTFSFIDPQTAQTYTVTTIALTTGSTIKFSSTDNLMKFPTELFLENFGTGSTGLQDIFSFSFPDAANGIIHVVSNGTATVTVHAKGSLDKIHWVDIGTATGVIAGGQFEIAVTKPYAYGRLNITVASASADGGANTIKAYRSGC